MQDVIIGALALHTLVGHDCKENTEAKYSALFRTLLRSRARALTMTVHALPVVSEDRLELRDGVTQQRHDAQLALTAAGGGAERL